jgi:hypothetical protein
MQYGILISDGLLAQMYCRHITTSKAFKKWVPFILSVGGKTPLRVKYSHVFICHLSSNDFLVQSQVASPCTEIAKTDI